VLGHWLDHLLNLKVVHAFAKKMLALATAVPSTVKQADSSHRGVSNDSTLCPANRHHERKNAAAAKVHFLRRFQLVDATL
jgi:hypothetical protein